MFLTERWALLGAMGMSMEDSYVSRNFVKGSPKTSATKITIKITKVSTAQLKDGLTRLKVFLQGSSSLHPQSRFPDLLAKSTGRDYVQTKLS